MPVTHASHVDRMKALRAAEEAVDLRTPKARGIAFGESTEGDING